MSFYALAWISTIAWGVYSFVGKLTSKYAISNPWMFNFVVNLFLLIFLIPTALYFGVGFPIEWRFLTLAAVSNAFWFFLYTYSLYRLDVSVLTPLFNFRSVFAVLLGGIFLGESLTSFQFLMFIVICIAGMFVSIEEDLNIRSFFNKNVAICILGMFFLALQGMFTNLTQQTNGTWETTLFMTLLTVLFMAPSIAFFKKDLKRVSAKNVSPLVLMALISVVGTVTSFEAYKSSLGITSLILAIPISMILAFAFSVAKPSLLENHSIKVYAIRFFATIVMIGAALAM